MNILLVDDSRLARQELRRLLQRHPDATVVGEAAHADEAQQRIGELQPDVLLLDIHMPGRSGFELLAGLDGAVPQVIFTTAFDQYAVQAFEVNALDYLLKPVDEQRLAAALAKARMALVAEAEPETAEPPAARELLRETDQVFVKDGERCWFVRLADVKLLEVADNYTRVHFHDVRPLITRSLQHLEARLDPKVFFRANRQQIINLKWIESVEPWFSNTLKIRLRGGQEVEVSRQQSIRFREALSL
ncbi:response regulator transcription factor [Hymenobacter busanensis]|uniref:Response regulator transcription factor n=1 Tax=Hymenobacter busanensis TaxID=2607656 RepID=A0A7L4ZVN3_9BACT|nr:LytTR family DNA-binding domain-containing protein [Hymenobacter busanensis]KAA9339151.1 response regulator transcription factor [Hymenobacter busanensis]QHJ07087.1 response regulator [Hymenobacter busanensis]